MQKNSDAQVRMWVKNWEGDEYVCTLYFVETAFYRVGLREFQGRGMRLDKLQDEYEVQRRMRVVGFLDTLFHQADRGWACVLHEIFEHCVVPIPRAKSLIWEELGEL